MNNRRAAYLGPPGTFSHEAAVKFWQPRFEIIPCRSAKGVVRAYREKKVDEAILAIDSSVGGTVGENLDEIAKLNTARIIGETILAVHHQLMTGPKGSTERIKSVLAHPKALEECEVWLSRNLPRALRIPVQSSAAAAKKAGADPTGETAAIASKTAAGLYGMRVLATDIETSPLNATRFWILGRKTSRATERDKTTLLVSGGLDGVLGSLVKERIRILSIYERPSGGKLESPFYFLDIEGHLENPPLSNFLHQFSDGRWLGSYPREY